MLGPMSATDRPAGPILCLGEAIVDLICEEEAESLGDASAFRPHFGGALANVAVSAARHGADAALAGGVGDDPWGEWLARRLAAEGVDLSWFSRVPGLQTPVAFVAFDSEREPTFSVYGDGIRAGIHSVAPRLAEAVGSASALVFGSNTLVGEAEREVTLRARDLAIAGGIPVLFDPNLRPNRWQDLGAAWELCRVAAKGAFVVRANLDEARGITGLGDRPDPADCAEAMTELGARIAVVTMGADGAIARGEADGEARAPRVDVVSPLGAGDAFLGALAAEAASGGWTPGAVVAGLGVAAAAGARACERWEAVG